MLSNADNPPGDAGDPPAGRPRAIEAELFRTLVESVSDYAIFVLSPTGHVMTWNAGARRIKGYTAADIVGKHFSVFYPPEANARRWPETELERATELGRFEDEGWRVRKDGTLFWANVVITALRNADGTLRGFAKVTRDLTERRQHEEALRRSEERTRLIIEGVRDYAIFMLDVSGIVRTWNAGAALIKQYNASEIVGRHFSTFYPPDAVAKGMPERELEIATRTGRFEEEGWRVRKDGSYFWANVVLTALRDDEGRLRGFAKVTRDMTERKRVERLEADAQRMNEFLAMLAHELRNPLAPIRNSANLLLSAPLTPERVAWAGGVIERQVAHLSRLVDDLLDVSRITQGKVVIERQPVDLRDVVTRAVEAATPLVESRRHELHVTSPAGYVVNGDLYRLTQVLSNLLHNAAKFTPEGGRIELEVRGDVRVEIHVRDNGEGISREMLPRVFELFAQGDSGLDRGKGGLGLGLTIARQIVELHGGAIEARSEGPGRGSELIVILPRASRPGEAHGGDAAGSPAPAGPLRVLVVDDNVDAATSLKLLLDLEGYETSIANDGMTALEMVAKRRPDVLLLDIGLPRLNGYDVARELRLDPANAGIRIIAVTGYAQEADRRRTREVGIDDHLVKPVDTDALLARLAAIASARGPQATPLSSPGITREK